MSRYLRIIQTLLNNIQQKDRVEIVLTRNLQQLKKYLHEKHREIKEPLKSPGENDWWYTNSDGKIVTHSDWSNLPIQEIEFTNIQGGIKRIYYICFKRNSQGQVFYGATIWKQDFKEDTPQHDRNRTTAKTRFTTKPIPAIIAASSNKPNCPAHRTRSKHNGIITFTPKIQKQFIKTCCKYGVRRGEYLYLHQLRQKVCQEINSIHKSISKIQNTHGNSFSLHERVLKIDKSSRISLDDYFQNRKMEIEKLKKYDNMEKKQIIG